MMNDEKSKSLQLARQFLGKEVEVIVDRPLGSKHPKHGFIYEVNYGYIDGVMAPDNEELDAYYLGVSKPIKKAKGIVKAIIHRLDDDDDKLVVMPENVTMSDQEIEKLISFQENFFTHQIIK